MNDAQVYWAGCASGMQERGNPRQVSLTAQNSGPCSETTHAIVW
jgi:hypothetical protein